MFSPSNSNYLKKIKFKYRKIVHYTLLASVILLQIIAIVIWYNETESETKLSNALENISSSKKITGYTSLINTSLIESQEHFNNYLNHKNPASFQKYATSLTTINQQLDSLRVFANENTAYKKTMVAKDKTEAKISALKSSIDSIINKQISKNPDEILNLFRFKKIESKKILDSVKTDSYIKVDSASQKKLFARLGDAFAGRVNVQKEQLNTVVTMRYKDKVISGNIEDQLTNVFHRTNNYYKNEFSNLKKTFLDLRNKDSQLILLNNELLKNSQNIIADYTKSANLIQINNEQNIINKSKSNKIIKSYSIVLLIVIMFIVSIILLSFTHIAFKYEKRLIAAKHQIKQSLIFKNRIMGMISHEIRSPLNIISMYSRKVRSLMQETELKDSFKAIEFTTNSLLLLSNQILEYSKDEKRKLNLNNKKLYLKPEIYQIITAMTSLAEVKGNKISINSNLEEDCEIYADAIKIHQLFYNTIGNANKFTENGNIDITVTLENFSNYEMNLIVKIADNGIGIAQSDLKNVFESYYQGTISKKVNDLGVGLGLNLCKEIVELFDGEIHVKSEENKGTTVEFNLILSKV